MGWMKYDMCGAATVMGVMRAVADLDLPIKVVGLIPAVENMPSGTATRPGDIITTSSGKTVEVDNTDAEGRLILADTLHYSARFNPDIVIDFATLTGACVVALGNEAAGMMGDDQELTDGLRKLGEEVGERVWPLPLYEEYLDYLKSEWADIKNAGSRWGGAVTAGTFLKQWVPEKVSWAREGAQRDAEGGVRIRRGADLDLPRESLEVMLVSSSPAKRRGRRGVFHFGKQ
jgi:leucyl aminopeptidase